MNKTAVLTVLNHKLMKLDKNKYELNLINNNGFTRKSKKLSFIDDVKLIMSMSPSTYKAGLYDYFNCNKNIVSSSGFIQSRQKIKEEAFKCLLNMINKTYPCTKTYKGYRLLATDGSDLNISYEPYDYETTMPNYKGHKTFNQYHINALYDILNNRYLDMILQPTRLENERQAMITMAESYQGDKAIFIADRGYESYNLYEHTRHTGNYFLIRIKDGSSRLFRNLPKYGEYDEEINITFTRNQTNKVKQNNEKYLSFMSNQKFDYFVNNEYQTNYRVIRFKLNNTYESIITNLSKDEFTTNNIKELYKLRWRVETSFRHI